MPCSNPSPSPSLNPSPSPSHNHNHNPSPNPNPDPNPNPNPNPNQVGVVLIDGGLDNHVALGEHLHPVPVTLLPPLDLQAMVSEAI